jgi:hypothetical protein
MHGSHNGLEVCAPEIDRSAHPCGRSPYSGYPSLCIAFPDSFIAEGEADDTIVILQPPRVRES